MPEFSSGPFASPSPYLDTPSNVADTGDAGTSALFAKGDHSHKTMMQRKSASVALTSGKGSVAFIQPYASGVVPVVLTEPETPDQLGYFYYSSVVPGSVTNAGFDVLVRKVAAAITLPGLALSLLGFVVNIFGAATGTINVKYIAAPETA